MRKTITSDIPELRSIADIEQFVHRLPVVPTVRDIYQDLLREFFLVSNPQLYFSSDREQRFREHWKRIAGKDDIALGCWVYWPWTDMLLHLPEPDQYYEIRTVRNRDIIPADVQQHIRRTTIGVAGLSVGLNALTTLVRLGIGTEFRLADYDDIAVSNFNRSVYTLPQVGLPKTDAAARSLLEIDPFLTVHTYPEGIREEMLEQFLDGCTVVVDAFDDFRLKLSIRRMAKRLKIPVVSGFDVEYGTLLIVERYDSEPDLPLDFFLNGYPEQALQRQSSPRQKTELFVNIIGKQYHSEAMLDSVYRVGTDLTGYPQLSIATSLAAGAFTYAVLEICAGSSMPSVRRFISLPELLRTA